MILDAQKENSLEANRESIGKTYKVIVDRQEKDYYIGRSYKDAPEIDQEIYINNHPEIKIGNFYDVKIYDSEEFDLFGEKI